MDTEHRLFVGKSGKLKTDPRLPTLRLETDFKDLDLFRILVHETAHVIDAYNPRLFVRQPALGSGDGFYDLSWHLVQGERPNGLKSSVGFPFELTGENFAAADPTLSLDEVDAFYQGLYASKLPSAYAATSPSEDFAESVAYQAIFSIPDVKYSVVTLSGRTFDLRDKITGATFSEKRKFVEEAVLFGELDHKYKFN